MNRVWGKFFGHNGHRLSYAEGVAGYVAYCSKCGRRSSYMPGFTPWWKKVSCEGKLEETNKKG